MPKKKTVVAVAKPKTKKVKVKLEEETPVKVSVETTNMEFETSAAKVIPDNYGEIPTLAPTRVFFDGREVVDILDDGKGNDKEYHCKMSDGTTTMVPKDLFVEKLKEE